MGIAEYVTRDYLPIIITRFLLDIEYTLLFHSARFLTQIIE